MRKLFALAALLVVSQSADAQTTGTLVVSVVSKDGPVAQAEVTAGRMKAVTGPDGSVTFSLPPGRTDVVVTKEDFDPGAAQVQIRAGAETRLEVALEAESELEENVVVSATRTDQRIADIPLRVEVLSGRYSQILADGLPLYGAQSGSVGILQIPPMDLGQVEVIKGVASALYGMSAIGGVVNLVSRRPKATEHELVVNRSTLRDSDGAIWLAQPLNTHWSYSVLGGAHWQGRSDFDHDGWSDLPMF